MKLILIILLIIYIVANSFYDVPKYFHFLLAIVILGSFCLDFLKAKKKKNN